jgi:multidrug efflux pump subunit AcrB
MARFFVHRPIAAMVISIITVLLGLSRVEPGDHFWRPA